MARHRPSVVWMMRPLGVYPNGYVRTCDSSKLDIVLDTYQAERLAFTLPRRDARLLAKRILQCLEETA